MKELLFIAILIISFAPALFEAPHDARAETSKSDPYNITRYLHYPEGVKKRVIAIIKFEPRGEWKWNKNYPFKFKLSEDTQHKLLEKYVEYSQRGEKKIIVSLHIELNGELQPLTVLASWGLCTPSTCRVYKKEIKF